MSTVIAVSNQKGGVGKTTTVVNVAAYAGLAGKRVLVIDNDPQANATSVFLPGGGDSTVYAGQEPMATKEAGVWICPASAELIDDERRLSKQDAGRFALRRRMETFRATFDLIIIDCPPTLTYLPMNALLAADYLLLPVQAEYFALEGLTQLLAFLEDLRVDSGAQCDLLGVVLTMFDARHPLSTQVAAEIGKHFGKRVLGQPIPRDVALAAAPSHGQSIVSYDPLSPGALAYAVVTKEILRGLK
jgi:chromosome partitioning protein